MRRVLLVTLLYLGGATALMVGLWWWQQAGAPTQPAVPGADGSFTYPTVVPPAGREAAAWKAGHLDGWKWCIEHVREGYVLSDDQLGGHLVGVADRDDGFRLGYATARAHAHAGMAAQGPEAVQQLLQSLRRRQPALYDLTVSAPPP